MSHGLSGTGAGVKMITGAAVVHGEAGATVAEATVVVIVVLAGATVVVIVVVAGATVVVIVVRAGATVVVIVVVAAGVVDVKVLEREDVVGGALVVARGLSVGVLGGAGPARQQFPQSASHRTQSAFRRCQPTGHS